MRRFLLILGGVLLVMGGSISSAAEPKADPIPREGTLTYHPTYVIEPPDTLVLEVRKFVPRPPYADELPDGWPTKQINGERLVSQDGTISLGSYGCVNVTGLTAWQAKLVLERYLSRWFLNPEISINVSGYNSKVYYVVLDGGEKGQQILRLPITGKETVLDAISNVGGGKTVTARHKIWVARPASNNVYQLFPVNWQAITTGGDPGTNWQLFPNDRIYVAATPPASSSQVVKISRKVVDAWKRWREPQKSAVGF